MDRLFIGLDELDAFLPGGRGRRPHVMGVVKDLPIALVALPTLPLHVLLGSLPLTPYRKLRSSFSLETQ
jgi:hypothetical protein